MRIILKTIAGFTLLLVGAILALPGVPGPGLVVIALGLALLSERFHWAARLLAWSKAKAERVLHREKRPEPASEPEQEPGNRQELSQKGDS